MTLDELRARAKRRKAEFEAAGEAPAHWADQHGYPRTEVYRVLNGMSPCKRGRFHEIAVKLGIKPGHTAH